MKHLRAFSENGQNVVAILLIVLYIGIALAAPKLEPGQSGRITGVFRQIGRATDREPQPPSSALPLGTLPGGIDIAYTLVWGTRSALRIGLLVAFSALAIGSLVGGLSGYFGGAAGYLTMRLTDAFLAFPMVAGVVMFQLIQHPLTSYGPLTEVQQWLARANLDSVTITLVLFSWMPYARVISAGVRQLRSAAFVQASQALGASPARIMARHLLPNAISPAIVFAARDIGSAVVMVAAFTFVGLGGRSEWAQILVMGRGWIVGMGGNPLTYWWTYLPATLAIALFGLAWNLLGDGLQAQLVMGTRVLPGHSWIDRLGRAMRGRWAPAAGGLVAGLGLGLLAGWLLFPGKPLDLSQAQLQARYKEDYLRAAIDSFSVTLDVRTAVSRYLALDDLDGVFLQEIRLHPETMNLLIVRAYRNSIEPFLPDRLAEAVTRNKLPPWLPALALLGGACLLIGTSLFSIFRHRPGTHPG
jgi:peptide/nickel transport system permease protein